MSRAVLLACAAALSACAGYTRGTLPATPPPPAWRPVDVLRERVAGGATGEIVINDRDGLSPDEAALMAVDRNPRLRVVRAERGIAGAEIITAGLLPNPRLDTSLEIPIAGAEPRALGFGAGVAWNVSPLFSRGRRVGAAEEAARAVDLEVAWQEWQVAQAARLHALRVIYLTRRLEAARAVETTWEQRLTSLRDAYQRSAVTALEVTGAERSLAEARLARMDIEQDIARARVDLTEALGLDPRAEVRVDASWRAPHRSPAVDVLLEHLPERRLDLIALRHAARSHDEALRAAVLAQFPPVEIGVHGGRDVEEVTSGAVTLTFDLPFFDRNQGNVARTRARRVQTEAEYDARLTEARAQVVRLSRELVLVDRKLATAAEASESAARLAALGRQASIAGGITPLVAADLEERASAARLRHLIIEQALAELWVGLVTASGTDERPRQLGPSPAGSRGL